MAEDYSSERRLTAAEEAIKALLTGQYTFPCDFCERKDDPDAPCSKVLGGTSEWCFSHAAWSGKSPAEKNKR